MHLSVDASPLLLRSAGVKNYLYHWIVALRRQSAGHHVAPFPFLDRIGDLTHDDSNLSRLETLPRIMFLISSNLRLHPAMRWVHRRADVFHVTNQIHHPVKGVALTTTLHDMTCWLMPELHTAANVKADHRFAAQIAAKAQGLIAVSENTRQDAIRMLNLDPKKVVTIHSGVAEPFFTATEAEAEALKLRLGLIKPYILNVGTIEPRKNLDTLLDAYLQLPSELRDATDLVLAGPLGWAAGTTSQRILSGIPGVRYLGYVSERDLPALTKGATLFAYPSLYEGFGFPVAQAMACEVPVITSNTSCLPEIAGDGALLVDPRSAEEISVALQKLLTAEGLRNQLGRNGRVRAEGNYRWDTCAKKSWDFFAQFIR